MLAIVIRVTRCEGWGKDAQVISVRPIVARSTTAGLKINSRLTVLGTTTLRPKYQ